MWHHNAKNQSALLQKEPDLKIPKQSHIFDLNNHTIEWVIYLNGHSEYKKNIATISLQQFPLFLDFCNSRINTALLVYSSCYAAGHNATSIYRELTSAEGASVYSFPIVTQAITDAPVRSRIVTYKNGQLQFPYNFNAFISTFINQKETQDLGLQAPSAAPAETTIYPEISASLTATSPEMSASPTATSPEMSASPTATSPEMSASPTATSPEMSASPTATYPALSVSPYEKSLVYIMPYIKAYLNQSPQHFRQRGICHKYVILTLLPGFLLSKVCHQ